VGLVVCTNLYKNEMGKACGMHGTERNVYIVLVCAEIHTEHINTLCGQNVEFVNVKLGGTYSNHWALGVYI
jgi:hypothetical protein